MVTNLRWTSTSSLQRPPLTIYFSILNQWRSMTLIQSTRMMPRWCVRSRICPRSRGKWWWTIREASLAWFRLEKTQSISVIWTQALIQACILRREQMRTERGSLPSYSSSSRQFLLLSRLRHNRERSSLTFRAPIQRIKMTHHWK